MSAENWLFVKLKGVTLDMNTVEELIAKHEGRKNATYKDSLGIPTIGIGHNIQAHPLPPGFVSPLTDEQVDLLFQADLANAEAALRQHLPWVDSLSDARLAVLVDMVFNMGIGGVLGFPHTLAAIQAGNWQAAHDGMLASKWATQVGARAKEDAEMMLTGEWPQ